MIVCTLQSLQVHLVHRDVSIQDTRVHACFYFIAPAGIFSTQKGIHTRYKSTCSIVLYITHRCIQYIERYSYKIQDRVHACLYFISPTGTFSTQKSIHTRYKSNACSYFIDHTVHLVHIKVYMQDTTEYMLVCSLLQDQQYFQYTERYLYKIQGYIFVQTQVQTK